MYSVQLTTTVLFNAPSLDTVQYSAACESVESCLVRDSLSWRRQSHVVASDTVISITIDAEKPCSES